MGFGRRLGQPLIVELLAFAKREPIPASYTQRTSKLQNLIFGRMSNHAISVIPDLLSACNCLCLFNAFNPLFSHNIC